jgi:hypothetical protein
VRRHPIVRVGLLLIAFRLAGLAARYLLQPDGPLAARLALFLPAAASHAAALLIIIAASLAVAAALPRFDRSVTIVSCAGFAILMIAGQADLTVSAITGAPLTPTVFRTYRGLHVVKSKEFLEPLRANLRVTLGGATAFFGVVVWIVRVIRRDAARAYAAATAALNRRIATLVVVGVALVLFAAAVPGPAPPPPIEVAFAREYLHLDDVHLGRSEAEAIAQLRRLVGLPPSARWVSEQYPLVYQPAHSPFVAVRRREAPDIVVVMVESLRAEDVAFVTGDADSVTPHLDALAARSVVFPHYISNAFPSAPSVLAFHCSAWPHRRKEIITDFAARSFDCLPPRLADLGYRTIYVGADPHFDNQDRWLSRWYETAVDLVAEGVPGTDRRIVSRAIDEIGRHDAAEPNRPLFAFVSTYSTHYPFTLPDDAGETPVKKNGDLRTQYRQTLRYTDREVGRLLSILGQRDRRTVVIVVGDHGFYVDLKRISGLPENDTVWTAALIAGPEDLIGQPRRITAAASHVDMMPTLLAMVGDERATASLGSDLLGSARTDVRSALAIRAGGVRLDRDGKSFIVDARTPNILLTRVGFSTPTPSLTPSLTPSQLLDWVNDWSYLVERDRVWSDQLIRANMSRSTRR